MIRTQEYYIYCPSKRIYIYSHVLCFAIFVIVLQRHLVPNWDLHPSNAWTNKILEVTLRPSTVLVFFISHSFRTVISRWRGSGLKNSSLASISAWYSNSTSKSVSSPIRTVVWSLAFVIAVSTIYDLSIWRLWQWSHHQRLHPPAKRTWMWTSCFVRSWHACYFEERWVPL